MDQSEAASHSQGLTGRVFQLRVGSGSGIGKNYRVGSGLGSGSGIGIIYGINRVLSGIEILDRVSGGYFHILVIHHKKHIICLPYILVYFAAHLTWLTLMEKHH